MSNLKSPFLRAVAPLVDSIELLMELLGVYEFMPSNEMMVKGGKLVCQDKSPLQEVCANVLFLLCGYNSQQFNRSLLVEILKNTPAGLEIQLILRNFLRFENFSRSFCRPTRSLCSRNQFKEVPNVWLRTHSESSPLWIFIAAGLQLESHHSSRLFALLR